MKIGEAKNCEMSHLRSRLNAQELNKSIKQPEKPQVFGAQEAILLLLLLTVVTVIMPS
jgi:hypothetical protein